MASPQLCQVVIQSNGGLLPARAMYPLGLNGRYECRLIGISWADRTDAKDNRIIYIRSDSFRKAYGNTAIVIGNRHESNMGNPQGEFPFYLVTSGGGIDISLEASTAYTGGAGNNHFDFCILSFSVTPME